MYAAFVGDYGRRLLAVARVERDALAARPRRGRVGVAPLLTPAGRRVGYFEAALEEDWSRLLDLASAELENRAADLRKLTAHQAEIARLVDDIPHLRLAGGRAIPASDLPGWAKAKREVRDAARSRRMDMTRVNAGLRVLETFHAPAAAEELERGTEFAVSTVDRKGRRQLTALAGARFARVVSTFNTARTKPRGRPIQQIDVRRTVDQLNDAAVELQSAFSEESPLAVRAEARVLGALAAKTSDRLAQELAQIAVLRTARPYDRNLANVGLACAGAMGEALRAHATALVATWVSGWATGGGAWTQWCKASALPFARPVRDARSVDLSALARNPSTENGRTVKVAGVVETVKIRHKDAGRKVISSVVVRAARGATIAASIPFVKADSGGLVPGAWCELTGIWRKSSKDVLGDPALELDRIAFAELGKRSWVDWVRAEIASVFWYPSHAINGAWTWERGRDGAVNPLRYGVWYRSGRGRRHGL
jgi:hypothetical protein